MSAPNPDRVAVDYASAIDTCRNVEEATALYADALSTYGPDGLTWRTVNGAILNRWSESTLVKIKRAAWKSAKEKR